MSEWEVERNRLRRKHELELTKLRKERDRYKEALEYIKETYPDCEIYPRQCNPEDKEDPAEGMCASCVAAEALKKGGVP